MPDLLVLDANGDVQTVPDLTDTQVAAQATAAAVGAVGNPAATDTTSAWTLVSLLKGGLGYSITIAARLPTLVSGRMPVDGSAVTQPVSAASLPLPAGAATAAKQPALGTAGTPSTDVITVQGRAGMTAVLVDGSGVTQPVSNAGTFAVQASQSGTWTVTGAGGTFPITAVSLPLPSGAATSAKQPALGTAGTPSTDVITVQGRAGMTAVLVDGSGVTQPVSNAGTFAVQAAQSGTWTVTGAGGTFPVTAASLPLPSGAATAAKQPALGTAGTPSTDVITVQGRAGMTAVLVDGSGVTQPVSAASLPLPSGASTSAKQPALGTAGTPSSDVITVQGKSGMTALVVDGSGVTQPVSNAGTFAVQAAQSGTWTVTGAGGTFPVTAASLPLPSGAATAAKQPALGTAGTPSTDVITVQGRAGMTAVLVDGSGVTQPVSAASLPLPSGASTSAKQPALGTAGTPSSDVITVQGKSGMTALVVDGSGVTQPVSNAGTFAVQAAQSGTWTVTGAGGTFPITAASLPLPSGAATAAKQPALGTAGTPSTDVITVQGRAGMTAVLVDGSGVTQPVSAASLPLPSGASTSAKQPALGTAGTPSSDVITVQGKSGMTALVVNGSGVTQPVSGTVAATQSGAWTVTQSGTWAVTQSGTWTVATNADGTAGSAVPSKGLLVQGSDGTNARNIATTTTGAIKIDLSGTAANTTAVKVDGSAVTQPVSMASVPSHDVTNAGTFAVQAAQNGTWTVTGAGGTFPVTADVGTPVFVRLSDGHSAVDTLPVSNAGTFAVQSAQSGTWTVQPGNTANTTPWLTNPHDPAATTGNITAADATVASSANSVGQAILTGTPDANSSVSVTLSAHDAVAVQLSGTFNGTVAFERSIDGGTTFVAMSMEEVGVGASAASLTISDNKAYLLTANAGALTTVRVRCPARTSGTLAVRLLPSFGVRQVVVNQGPPQAVAYAWPIKVTDGTNTMPTGDTAARSIFHTPAAGTTGGCSVYRATFGNSNNATTVKASAAQLYSVRVVNLDTANPLYVRLYNQATNPTPASDNANIVDVIYVPAAVSSTQGSSVTWSGLTVGASPFTSGLAFVAVTGVADTNNTSVAANGGLISVYYK